MTDEKDIFFINKDSRSSAGTTLFEEIAVEEKPPSSSKTRIEIYELSGEDLTIITEIHCSAFPETALTKLGGETVRRYYEWQMDHAENALIIGAFVREKMAGFCFGGRFKDATSGFLKHNKFYILWRIASHPWLVRDRIFRERISFGIKVLRKKMMRKAREKKLAKDISLKKITEFDTRLNSFGILSIAVDSRFQGEGVGYELMRASEDAARLRKYKQMNLSVHTDNLQAIRFYEKCGWERLIEKGIWRGNMRKTL